MNTFSKEFLNMGRINLSRGADIKLNKVADSPNKQEAKVSSNNVNFFVQNQTAQLSIEFSN